MADITFGPIVKGVVGIVLVVASIAIVISLFNPLAGQIFGFFKDVLNFDPIPFTGDREEIWRYKLLRNSWFTKRLTTLP